MQSIRITRLRANDVDCPLGIDDPYPRLTWALASDEGQAAPAVRVIAASAPDALAQPDLWDSGWLSEDTAAISYGGPMPLAGQRIWWCVLAGSEAGTLAMSDISWFEMGLPDAAVWHGQWIAADEGQEAPVLTHAFRLGQLPRKARAHVAGLGFFELYVNGERIGDEVLQPVWTAYSRQPLTNMLYPYDYQGTYRVPYRTFDIGPALREGENTLAVWLGNGWYHQNIRNVEGDLWYGEGPKLLMDVRIDAAAWGTDESWQWRESQLTHNSIFRGEVYDARRQDFPLHPVRLAAAPDGRLCAQACPADRAMEAYPAQSARPDAGDGRLLIVDFGQNLSGWVSMTMHGQPGDRVEMRFAEEVMDAGGAWTMDYRSAGGEKQIQQDVYILRGGESETYTPRFTWHGFRYAQFTLVREEQPVPLSLQDGALVAEGFRADAEAVFVTVNHRISGELSTPDPTISWFHGAFLAAMRSNQHGGVPLDCPHRERLGYTGDGQVTAEAILLNADAMPFYRKWLDDILDAQHRVTGHIPHTAPFYNGGGGPGGWGGAVVFVPWAMYRCSGDRTILQKAYPAMARFMAYLQSRSEDGIVVREEAGGWCLGDWCTPEKIELPPALVNTYFAIIMADRMADMADILGEGDEGRRMREHAASLRAAFHQTFYRPEEDIYDIGRQGANAFALHAGIPPAPLRAQVFAKMVAQLEARQWHFDTGIFATPLVLEVLTQYGRPDLAYAMLTVQDAPGLAAWKARGATTLWEHWDDGGSHNHVMFGGIEPWLYAYVGGIAQAEDSAGWAHVLFRPGWIEALAEGAAQVETPRGTVSIAWRRAAGTLHVHSQTPAAMRATLCLPEAYGGACISLPAGSFDGAYPHIGAQK